MYKIHLICHQKATLLLKTQVDFLLENNFSNLLCLESKK